MAQHAVKKWDDIDINPYRKDILISISACHRNEIFLIRFVPCIRLVTSQKEVSSIATLEPVLKDF
jgi:hypothetical protein